MACDDIIMLLVGNAILFGVLQFAATTWLKARLEASIRHEYDRRLEAYRRELDRRDRAAMVAELFAEWSSFPKDPKRLNQLTWEASLWLPANIVKEVSKRLSNSADAHDVREILVDVRKHLSTSPDDISAHEIVHFPKTGA